MHHMRSIPEVSYSRLLISTVELKYLVSPRNQSSQSAIRWSRSHHLFKAQILGGYVLTAFLTPWTLLIKAIGLALAVASGLSLGKEARHIVMTKVAY